MKPLFIVGGHDYRTWEEKDIDQVVEEHESGEHEEIRNDCPLCELLLDERKELTMMNFTVDLGLKQAGAARRVASEGEYMSLYRLVRHLKVVAPKVTPEMKKQGWAWAPATKERHR